MALYPANDPNIVERVLDLFDTTDLGQHDIARAVDLSQATVSRIIRRHRQGVSRVVCDRAGRRHVVTIGAPTPPARRAGREHHTLYRFYDADGRLLYVGITDLPGRRFKEHSAAKDWWPLVVEIKIEHLSSRPELEASEAAAIKAERPLYNVEHTERKAFNGQVVTQAAQQ